MSVEWTDEVIALLGKKQDVELARMLGVSRMMIKRKRDSLNIPPCAIKACGYKRQSPFTWSEAALAMLGTEPDADVALKLGVSRHTVWRQRKQLGIKVARSKTRKHKLPEDAIPHLGVLRDSEIAHQFGVPTDAVYNARRKMNIPAPPKPPVDYERLRPDLGTASDWVIGEKHRVSYSTIQHARVKLGIAAFNQGEDRTESDLED